jgi:RNA polymerase sigma factor (sigma-70 family)
MYGLEGPCGWSSRTPALRRYDPPVDEPKRPPPPQDRVKALFIAHSAELVAFFRSSRRMSKSDASDLLQQTFEELLKAFERHPDFELQHPRGFLFCVAHRQCGALVQRQQRREALQERYAANGSTPDAEADDLEFQASLHTDRRLLLRAMRRLSGPDERGTIGEAQVLLYLRFFADLTLVELAEVFDIPVGTVPGRLRRALRLLQHQVEALDAPDADSRITSTAVLEQWRLVLRREAKALLPTLDDRDDDDDDDAAT